ncbi:hypothetical protein KAR91_50670 [Candidatus Pacearchaeota archaeon]|nr:hypothetical protein [Candidatus Pacearchaeota archaeon]
MTIRRQSKREKQTAGIPYHVIAQAQAAIEPIDGPEPTASPAEIADQIRPKKKKKKSKKTVKSGKK